MRLIVSLAVALLAAPALATGERIVVTAAAEPFRETLCVSMTCVSAGQRDAVVSARRVKEGLELTVKTASGQTKLVHVAPIGDEGSISSIDLVRASSLAVKAIEAQKPLTAPAPIAKAKPAAKLRLFARR
jgi:hypothetical protein